MILGGGSWVCEPVVSRAHVVLEGGGAVWQLVGVGDVLQEGLLRATQLHLAVHEETVIQVLQSPVTCSAVAHLNHSRTLLALQEFYLQIQTVQ